MVLPFLFPSYIYLYLALALQLLTLKTCLLYDANDERTVLGNVESGASAS